MAGKTQGDKIDELKEQVANLVARLDAHEIQLKQLNELLTKGSEASSGMTVKVAVIEERLLVLTNFKDELGMIATLE